MYSIKAIYDGTNFKPSQPIPVKEDYEVIITFVEPLKKTQTGIMKYFNMWEGENLLDLDTIMSDRKKFFSGRMENEDFS